MKSANDKTEKSRSKNPESPAPAPAKGFQRWAPWAITIFFGLWLIGNLRPHPVKSAFNVDEFGKLPVVLEGRIQPMDSVARNTLLIMRGKQTLAVEPEGDITGLAKVFKTKRMPAIEWLLEVMTRPEEADARKLFRIDHPELKGLLKLPEEEKHFSLNEIRKNVDALQKESDRIQGTPAMEGIPAKEGIKEEVRTPYEKAVARLSYAMITYFRLQNSLQPQGSEDFAKEVAAFQAAIPKGRAAIKSMEAKEDYNEQDLTLLTRLFNSYRDFSKRALPFVVPPEDPSNKEGWATMGTSLMEAVRTSDVKPAAIAYAQMATAYAKKDPGAFNKAVSDYQGWLKANLGHTLTKGTRESFFNHYEFFIKSLTVYLVSFLFACVFWFKWSPWLRTTGVQLAVMALVVHTAGLIYRMYLEGRPPVTNLYSSAVFIGWGCVVFGIVLEWLFKRGIAVAVGSFLGFVTLVIAHNLSLDSDTLKVLVAVLDHNIWLATHVVIITLGYSAMFLMGLFAIVYVILGVLTPRLDAVTSKMLSRIVYGIACFATFFSFVGTVLGGIWADQSWGRFWGWDVKENGALMIVIWCAVMLHARWGGLVRERGLMAMAIFGNIITSFSWFGVNMLGIGLHSYGFMDEAFKWLMAFIVSQVALIGMALLPLSSWRSTPGGPGSPGAATASGKKSKETLTPGEEFVAAQKIAPPKAAS